MIGIAPIELTPRDVRMARKVKGMVSWMHAGWQSPGDEHIMGTFDAGYGVSIDGTQAFGACLPHIDNLYRDKFFVVITVHARRLGSCASYGMEYPRVFAIEPDGLLSYRIARPFTAFRLDPMRTHWLHMLRPTTWRAVMVIYPRDMKPRKALDVACDWSGGEAMIAIRRPDGWHCAVWSQAGMILLVLRRLGELEAAVNQERVQ